MQCFNRIAVILLAVCAMLLLPGCHSKRYVRHADGCMKQGCCECMQAAACGGCAGGCQCGGEQADACGGAMQAPASDVPYPDIPARPREFFADMKSPALRQFTPAKAAQVTLDNGLVLFLMENHELPLVDVTVWIRTGSLYDTEPAVGVAGLAAEVMRSGGTMTHDPDTLNQMLEDIAASVETGMNGDFATASASSMSKDFGKTLELLADVLQNPAFRQDKFDLAMQQVRGNLARQNDDPNDVADREWPQLLYGEHSPYARTIQAPNLAAITRDSLVAFHKKYYYPGNMIVGVFGDFKADEMAAQIKKAFSWGGTAEKLPALPAVEVNLKPNVNLIERTGMSQSNIYLGHLLDLSPTHPDTFRVSLAMQILGQGFSSRLMKKIRSEHGYAYSVYSAYRAEYGFPGRFEINMQTQANATCVATKLAIEEVKKMCAEPVTQEELDLAKESILNAFVFNFANPTANLSRAMRYYFRGLPEDLVFQYQNTIREATLEDMQRVMKAYIQPDKLSILVVGDPKTFDGGLDQFGTVNLIDITLPKVEQTAPVVDAKAVEKGRAVVAAVVEAHGGKDAILAVKGLEVEGDYKMTMGQTEMPFKAKSVVTSTHSRHEGSMMGQSFVRIVTPEKGWMEFGGQKQELPAAELEQERMDMVFGNYFLGLIRHMASGEAEPAWLGEDKLNGTSAIRLQLRKGEQTAVVWVDSSSQAILQSEFQNASGVTVVNVFGSVKQVDSVSMAFEHSTDADGNKFSGVASSIKLLDSVDENLFKDE